MKKIILLAIICLSFCNTQNIFTKSFKKLDPSLQQALINENSKRKKCFGIGSSFDKPEKICCKRGKRGKRGPRGHTGASGLPNYGYIYNVSAQSVDVESDIVFDSNGLLVGITHVAGSNQIFFNQAGTYRIDFSLSATARNEFALFVNNVVNASAIYGSGDVFQQNSGQVIITVLAGDFITIRNHTSLLGTITLQTLAGGTAINVNASILIQQLA